MRNRKWEIGWQYGGIPFKPRLKRLRPERRVRFRRSPAFRIRRLPIFARPRVKNSTSRLRRIDFRSDVGRATRLRLFAPDHRPHCFSIARIVFHVATSSTSIIATDNRTLPIWVDTAGPYFRITRNLMRNIS